MADSFLTAELAARGIKAMTSGNIDAAGGDTTARSDIATLKSSLASAIARIQALENVSRLTITGTPPSTGKVGTAYSFTPTVTNGSGTKTFTLSSGTLLGGLSFSTTTGTISGSPTVAGTMSGLVITVTDSTGSASTVATNVTISAVSAATGDITALRVRDATLMDTYTDSTGTFGIDGNGWIAEVTLKGLTAPAADIASDAFFDCKKLELLVSDPGFRAVSGSITTATVFRKIIGRAVLRKQFKTARSDINGRFIMQSGSDLVVYVALSDQVYAGSTIVSAKIASGFYVNGSDASTVSSASSLANASTYAYRKPTATWLNTQHLRATGDFPVEMIAFHRHAMGGRQVAGIKFQARDTTGNVTAEQTVATTALTSLVTATSLRPEVYKATIPVSALNQGELCFANAKVYPHIGDASAVYDLSVDGLNTGLVRVPDVSPHTRLRFLNDKAGTYGGITLCDANAIYTPIASSSSTSTPSNAFDGNYTTGFGWLNAQNEANSWVGQTFPLPVNVAEVRIWANGAEAKRTFTNFDLEYSTDGTTWVKSGATQTAATWTTPYSQMQAFSPGGNGPTGGANYWRVRQNGTNPNSPYVGAQEIEFAAVAGGPNIATGVTATTLAEARKYPVTTVVQAFKSLKAFHAAKGHDDYAGGKLYLGNTTTTAVEYGAESNIPSPAVMGLTWCEIMPDPSAAGPVKWTGKAPSILIPSMMRAVGLTIKSTPGQYGNNTTFKDPDSATGYSMISLEGCLFEAGTAGLPIAGSYGIADYNIHYRTNCSSTNGGNVITVAGFNGVKAGMALALGNAQPVDATPVPSQIFVANTGGVFPTNSEVNMPPVTDGYFFAYNNLSFTNSGPAATLRGTTRPTVIVQNVLEFKGTSSAVITFNRSAEGGDIPVYEMLDMNNTMVGNRGSRLYCEGPQHRGLQKEGVSIGNVDMQWNIKTDSFDSSSQTNGAIGQPGCTGNWRYYHQTGLRSNAVLLNLTYDTPSDSSYRGKAWEPTYSSFQIANDMTGVKALFVNYQAQGNGTNANGTGGGDYHPASKTNALNNRMPVVWASYNAGFTDTINGSVFTYDVSGTLRRQDGTGAAGALES